MNGWSQTSQVTVSAAETGRLRIATLGVVALLAVASCGGDDSQPTPQTDDRVKDAAANEATTQTAEPAMTKVVMPDACEVVDERRAQTVLNVMANVKAPPAFDPPPPDYRYSENSDSECIYKVGSAYLFVAVFAGTPCEPNPNDTVPAHAIPAPITAFASESTSCGALKGGSVYTLFGGSFSGASVATVDEAWVEFYAGLPGT